MELVEIVEMVEVVGIIEMVEIGFHRILLQVNSFTATNHTVNSYTATRGIPVKVGNSNKVANCYTAGTLVRVPNLNPVAKEQCRIV